MHDSPVMGDIRQAASTHSEHAQRARTARTVLKGCKRNAQMTQSAHTRHGLDRALWNAVV